MLSTRVDSVTTRITKRFQKIVGLCYPLLHAGTEGMYVSDFLHFDSKLVFR